MSAQESSLKIRVGVAGVTAALTDLKKLASGVTGTFGFITAELDPRKLFEPIKEIIGMGSEFVKLRNQTGATISSLVGIDKAFKRIGGSAAENVGLISKMQKTIAEAVQGNPEAKKGFGALGLDPQELASLSADKQLFKIGDAITKLGNDAQAAQVALQIFGKSGAQMLAVFRNDDAMALLRDGGGKFGDVIGRNADSLEHFTVQLNKLKSIPKQIAAGFIDMLPVDELTSAIKHVIDSIDFVGVGQKVGAWVSLVIEYWKAGRIDEIIDLTIEAGFEQGKKGVALLWDEFKRLFSKDAFKLIAVQFSISMTDAVADLAVDIVVGLGKAFVLVAAEFTKVLDKGVTAVLNFFVDGINKVAKASGLSSAWMGGALSRFQETPEADLDKERDQQIADIEAGGSVIRGWIDKFFKSGSDAAKDLWGKSGAEAVTGGATAKLASLIAEMQAKILGTKKPEVARQQSAFAPAGPQMSTLEDYVNVRLPELKKKLAEVEADYTKTTAEKWAIRKGYLEDEQRLLGMVIDELQRKADMPGLSESERNQTLTKQRHFQGQLNSSEEGLAKIGPDPSSFSQQFVATFADLKNQMGTFAQSTARAFADVFNSAISSISNGIMGLIKGTMTWGQALQEIGETILTSIIQAIVQMGVRWVLTQIMMAIAGKAILASATAATVPFAVAQSAIWAVPATLSTIASYGGAAAAAPAQIALAEAITMSESVVGFEKGGFTGFGGNSDVAGLVHRNEFVMPADATSRIGLPRLEAMKNGEDDGGINVAASPVHVIVVNDASEVRRYMESNAGERIVVQHVNKRRFDLGMGT